MNRQPLRRLLTIGLACCALLAAGPLDATATMPQERPGHLVGIDVSHWQGRIAWKRVKSDGIQFVFAKATEAHHFVDGEYARNRRRADALGIPFTAYHFARPDRSVNDAVREADHFLRVARLGRHHLAPVLDLETTGGLGPKRLSRWVKEWLGRVESRLGVKPIIYTGPHFWQTYMSDTRWFARNGFPVWIAHWHVDQPRVPAGNWAGRSWTFWQQTDCGRVAGIGGCVDVDLFRGEDIRQMTIRRLRAAR